MKILITGGAGFIGRHLTRHLLRLGHQITILDNFLPQVHAGNIALPKDIEGNVRLMRGDVADPSLLQLALQGQCCVIHLAAETGTGQSMYEVSRYEHTNLSGTALLYDTLVKNPRHGIERIVVASSRAIYGEGAYFCEGDGLVYPNSRSEKEKRFKQFDPVCPHCEKPCETVPTSETAPAQPSSFYGLTKHVQEKMVLMFGQVLGIPSFALRYQNVYGPGQSLQNPYTGILAIFSNLARTGRRIQIFEDGMESRDFVYVDDVVRATASCIKSEIVGCHAVNVGSGVRTTVLAVADQINSFYGDRSEVKITGAFRDGDIRHGLADLGLAHSILGYEPSWSFAKGLEKFLQWADESEPTQGVFEQSLLEMTERGLLHASKEAGHQNS
jgi:dTDP-L-rhamnose 4-epimerase